MNSILIIALPRTGSTNLGTTLSKKHGLEYIFEPFNFYTSLPVENSYHKKLVKTMVFDCPKYINENQRLNFILDLTKKFEEVILLSRKDLNAVVESWSYLKYNNDKNFNSKKEYFWEETPNLQIEKEFIKNCQKDIDYLSNHLNVDLTYYEDLYDPNSPERYRKGFKKDVQISLI